MITVLIVTGGTIQNYQLVNNHLEQIARAFFKSWFIDFEPFGGEMPIDWQVGNLTDIASYLNGLTMQRFRPTEGENGLPVLKTKNFVKVFVILQVICVLLTSIRIILCEMGMLYSHGQEVFW